MKMFWQPRGISCLPIPGLGPHTCRLVTDLVSVLTPSLPPLPFLPTLVCSPYIMGPAPRFLANWLLCMAVTQDQEAIPSIHHGALWPGRGKREERLMFDELGVGNGK